MPFFTVAPKPQRLRLQLLSLVMRRNTGVSDSAAGFLRMSSYFPHSGKHVVSPMPTRRPARWRKKTRCMPTPQSDHRNAQHLGQLTYRNKLHP
jgi:hypothetical protein